jgi:uncharacterized protein YdaU (DUF1376 family)
MTNRRPTAFMPLWIGDYLADTTHLTTEQHGAYLLLLMAYWRRGGPLADDDQSLCRIAGVTIYKWRALRSAIAPFFAVEGGLWVSKRADEELAKAESKYEKRASAGRKGGQASAVKGKRLAYSAPVAASAPLPTVSDVADAVVLAEISQSHHSNAVATPPANEQQSQSESLRTTDSSSSQSQSSEANASGPTGPVEPFFDLIAMDPVKDLWGYAIPLLVRSGRDEKGARRFLGKLCKTYEAADVLDAFETAETKSAPDPGAYAAGVLTRRSSKKVYFNGKATSGQFGRNRQIIDDHPLGNFAAIGDRIRAASEGGFTFDA